MVSLLNSGEKISKRMTTVCAPIFEPYIHFRNKKYPTLQNEINIPKQTISVSD